MVSKASDDFPDPLNPVMTVKDCRGISTSIFFRLCWRAPCTVMRLSKWFYFTIRAVPALTRCLLNSGLLFGGLLCRCSRGLWRLGSIRAFDCFPLWSRGCSRVQQNLREQRGLLQVFFRRGRLFIAEIMIAIAGPAANFG